MIKSNVSCICKFLLLYYILSFPVWVNAQQVAIDSLKAALRQHPTVDSLHLKLLADLAYTYHTIYPDSTTILAKKTYELSTQINYEKGIADALKVWAIGSYLISEYDEAIERNKQALEIYEKLGELKGAGAVLNNIAIIKNNQGAFDEALDYYKKSLEIRIKINDQIGIAACYNNIGNTYSDKGNFSEALIYLFRGLRLREKINSQLDIANSLANIANIYYYLGKYDAALNYSSRSLKIHESIGNNDGMIHALVGIGGVYDVQKKHTQALAYFERALRISEEMGNPHSVSLCMHNIGDEYYNLGQLEKAIPYYKKSLAISEESGDKDGIAISNNGIAKSLLLSNPHESVKHAHLSYELASEIGARLVLMESAQNLSKGYARLNDYKQAYYYLQKTLAYKDSLFNDEVTKKAAQIEFNFLLDKKQREISLLEKDRAIQKEISDRRRLGNISLLAVLGLSIALVIALWNNSRKTRKAKDITFQQKEEISRQAEELRELNTLKDKIFSVLSHDLRSPVVSLSGIMTLMDQDMLTPEEFAQVKKGLSNQLDGLSLLLDNLLFWSRSQINGHIVIRKERINVIPIIYQNIQLLSEYAHQKQVGLTLINSETDEIQAFADINHVGIVIRNLISNAIKFTNPNGKVEVEVESTEQTILIKVKDTGIGMDETLASQLFSNKLQSKIGTSGEKGTGLGLLLCKDFAEQNNGTLSVTSKPGVGSTFYFILPKA